jgi:hypothetical protein
MKKKLTDSKTAFLSRKNYTGSLSNDQVVEFGEMVSQVTAGSLKNTVRVYPKDKSYKKEIVSLLKNFGNAYPYKNIGDDLSYLRYVLKDKSNRGSALSAMQRALNEYNRLRISSENQSLEDLLLGDDDKDSGSSNEDGEENTFLSIVKHPATIVIVILAVAAAAYFFILKK